jgi:hypothetical protein
MKKRLSALLSLLAITVAARESWAAPDVKVCVEVTLRAPAEKSPVESRKKTDQGLESSAPGANGAAPADGPLAPGEPADVAPNTAASPSSSESRALAGPRVVLVDHSAAAEEAASIASEIDPQGSQDPRVQSGAHLPVGQTPTVYLKRLMEHFVTHEPGYVASQEGCTQRINVELYPLKAGWTAFARYSGTGREERVDQLLPTELSQFAERSVLALLHDVSISMTVDRDNVLWSDSLKSTQRIRGRGHVVLGVGTRVRAGRFNTLVNRGSSTSKDGVDQRLRLFTPMALSVGYRGQFDQFGVEALAEMDLGAGLRAAAGNPSGGHVDYGGSGGVVLHVLRYTNPRGLTSPYFGAGANFAVHWFRAIKAQEHRSEDARSTLFGGGLDVDVIGGYEFMRASAISFYLQGELNLPAYVVRSENNDGRINTWFPGAAFRLGASF